MTRREKTAKHGFSLVELMIVLVIVLAMAGIAIPNILQMTHMARLMGVGTSFSGLIQQARIRSVQDDRSYSMYVNAPTGATPSLGYVDLQQTATLAAGDPEITLPTEVTLVAAANAPATANLKTQLLPAGAPASTGPKDAATVSATPITFSPRGLPCTPTAGACSGATGLAPVAYWAFFQNTITTQWEAVTVSPAGRIQKWTYSANGGGVWSKM